MNLYLAQSPLQILAACEARAAMGGPDDALVVMLSPTRETNNQQMLMTLETTAWPQAIIVRPRGVLSKLRLFAQITRLGRQGLDRLFIGDFRSLWMHRVRALSRPRETWLLDDGAVTPMIQQNFLGRGVFWPPQRKGMLQKHLRQLLNQLIFKAGRVATLPIHVFSAFHLPEPRHPEQQIIRHHYAHLRDLVASKRHQERQVYFFGSKLSEAAILDHDFELTSLQRIARWYGTRNMDFVYIPHRGDSQRKLEALAAAGIPVSALGMPAELFFALAQNIPAHIATFYSSALNNLASMYDFTSMQAFVLPPAAVRHPSPEGLRLAYASLEQAGVRLLELEAL